MCRFGPARTSVCHAGQFNLVCFCARRRHDHTYSDRQFGAAQLKANQRLDSRRASPPPAAIRIPGFRWRRANSPKFAPDLLEARLAAPQGNCGAWSQSLQYCGNDSDTNSDSQKHNREVREASQVMRRRVSRKIVTCRRTLRSANACQFDRSSTTANLTNVSGHVKL